MTQQSRSDSSCKRNRIGIAGKSALSWVGLFLMAPYSLITLASFVYTFYMLNFHPANSELVAVWPIVMTEPWSLILFKILEAYTYEPGSIIIAWGVLIAGALLNSLILYTIGLIIGAIVETVLKPGASTLR